jgi:hypothetical protein
MDEPHFMTRSPVNDQRLQSPMIVPGPTKMVENMHHFFLRCDFAPEPAITKEPQMTAAAAERR